LNIEPFQYRVLDRWRIEISSAAMPEASAAEAQTPAPPLQPLLQLLSL
jgi:hypothetical protein